MSEHTPGPWVQFAIDGKPDAIMPAMREGDICTFRQPPTDADARLMTAAPELLKALTELSHMYTVAWDRADGGLMMFDKGLERFEKAHHAAQVALSTATGAQLPLTDDDFADAVAPQKSQERASE